VNLKRKKVSGGKKRKGKRNYLRYFAKGFKKICQLLIGA
jgi:hypothetical protein